MSLFSGNNRHTASVRALTHLRLMQVTRSDLDSLLHHHPQLAYEIISLLSRRLEESENLTIRDLREKNRQLQEAYDELKAAQDQLIEKEKLEKELEITKQIQESILPDSLPNLQGYEFGALMIPARVVGGDFYTFFQLPGRKMGIVVGNVSDKGVPAALFMALCYSLIRSEAVRTGSPVQALKKVNEQLLQMNSSDMFVTVVYGILDPTNGDFHFARAAHPCPILLDKDGNLIEISTATGQPLGLFENSPIDEQRVLISPGGTLLLFSDGVNETANQTGDEFGYERVNQTISNSRTWLAQEICTNLWQQVQTHGKGIPQQDDFTAVVVKRLTGS